MRSYVLASRFRQFRGRTNRYPYCWPILYFLSLAAALVYVSLLGLLWFLAWFSNRKLFYGLVFRFLVGFRRVSDWISLKLAVSAPSFREKE